VLPVRIQESDDCIVTFLTEGLFPRCYLCARKEDSRRPPIAVASHPSCVETRSSRQSQLFAFSPDDAICLPYSGFPYSDREPNPAFFHRSQSSGETRTRPSASSRTGTARHSQGAWTSPRRPCHSRQVLQPDGSHAAQDSGGSSRPSPHRRFRKDLWFPHQSGRHRVQVSRLTNETTLIKIDRSSHSLKYTLVLIRSTYT
jgi:hypothetical protein